MFLTIFFKNFLTPLKCSENVLKYFLNFFELPKSRDCKAKRHGANIISRRGHQDYPVFSFKKKKKKKRK